MNKNLENLQIIIKRILNPATIFISNLDKWNFVGVHLRLESYLLLSSFCTKVNV